jgi:hypothetical protein
MSRLRRSRASVSTSPGERGGATPPNTATLLALAGIGAGLATLLFLIDLPFDTTAEKDFLARPAALLWFLTIVTQISLWLIAAKLVAGRVGNLRAGIEKNGRTGPLIALVVLNLFILAVLFLFSFDWSWWPFASLPDYPLANRPVKIAVLYFVGVPLTLVPVYGVLLVRARVNSLVAPHKENANATEQVRRDHLVAFFDLREDLRSFLILAGTIVFTATLSVGALRSAILAAAPEDKQLAATFPAEYVLVYGLFFSLMLAAIYVPTYGAVRRFGEAIRNAYMTELDATPTSKEFRDWNEERTKLTEALKLNEGTLSTFRAGAFIAAPLLGSLVSLLLPSVKL